MQKPSCTKAAFFANVLKPTIVTVVLALFVALIPRPVNADNPDPGVIPPQSKAFGRTYGEWAAKWQQWAFGIPAAQNPLTDSTGEFCDVKQGGPVWFLAGNFGGTTERYCTVPERKALFFPVVNSFYVKTEPTEPTDPAEIRAMLHESLAGATYACEIDGQAVENLEAYFTDSPLFTTSFPKDNLFGIPKGHYKPSMNSGWYLMLPPLAAGEHTIHFAGTVPAWDMLLDVTYHLGVGKEAKVYPPNSKPHGQSYGEWGAAWWQWALGIPTSMNPVLDSTGEFCAVDQSGPVWFLAGNWGGETVRTGTVPDDKALFIPLFNTAWGAAVWDCNNEEDCDLPALVESAAGATATVSLLEAEVDGVRVQDLYSYRAISPDPFPIMLPEDNVVDHPAGLFGPNVSDGYGLMLKPLHPGQHTIHIHSLSAPFGDPFDVDVTYHLNVVKH